jgi:hypothetical protein
MDRRTLLKNTAILLGGIASSSVTRAVLAGVDSRVAIEKPIFTAIQREKCSVLTEMIIPRTDTPGAIEAGVPHFVEVMVSDWYTDRERQIFFAGLKSLDQYCKESFSKPFLACNADQRINALEQAEKDTEGYKAPTDGMTGKGEGSLLPGPEDEGKPFFTKIKELTVLGYYTSEVGAKQELRYDPMPMEYKDIDFADVGRQWSS